MRSELQRSRAVGIALFCFFAATATNAAAGIDLDTGTAVEGCIGCHAAGTALPVGDVTNPRDAHYIDLDPRGPATDSGYRRLDVDITGVDATGATVILDFVVTDEDGGPVVDLFASDGRFNLARLVPASSGNPSAWQTILFSERFTTGGGLFQAMGGGAYRYTSAFDPGSVPIATDTLRLAVQISAGDLPPANAWCDFDADLGATDCTGPVSVTRDIVQTATCNGCHGATSDTKLRVHGHRTEVEYCVTCHNPGLGDFDFTSMIHKIHYGANLTMPLPEGLEDFAHVEFTRDISDCTTCHTGGGADVENWHTEPNRTACGACHDDVNFDTGENHGQGGVQPNNLLCRNCHRPPNNPGEFTLPVETNHRGEALAEEAALYRDGDGISIDQLTHDADADTLTIDYSVRRDGAKMLLHNDPRWTNGGRLALQVGWSTEEYTNEGSGSDPAPAQPVSTDARVLGGAVTHLGGGDYRAVVDLPNGASDTAAVVIEGHPVVNIPDHLGDDDYLNVPAMTAVDYARVERRGVAMPRRAVVEIAKCNQCHDAAGAGLSFHGENRTGNDQACVVCHNSDATDIRRRPADPGMTPDGKREVPVDMKYMIHAIHAGVDRVEGYVAYGFGGPVDFSHVEFIGNLENCETCHLPGTYGAEHAWNTLPTTIDTGAERTDPEDDLNISPVAATCSSCHDTDRAKRHMVLNGASFMALQANVIGGGPVPEPGSGPLACAAGLALAALARRGARARGGRRG